jgi:hypothetical protein
MSSSTPSPICVTEVLKNEMTQASADRSNETARQIPHKQQRGEDACAESESLNFPAHLFFWGDLNIPTGSLKVTIMLFTKLTILSIEHGEHQ